MKNKKKRMKGSLKNIKINEIIFVKYSEDT